MTREEVTKVLALLSAYYDRKPSSMKTQAITEAWYYVIGEYDYGIAKRAIVEFVKNDTRDYATFPSAGVIRKAIEEEMFVPNRIFNKLRMGKSYGELTKKEQGYITEEWYHSLSTLREENLLDMFPTIISKMRDNEYRLAGKARPKITEGANNGN